MDTIVYETRSDPSNWKITKNLTKKELTYLKYQDIIVNDKITCKKCNVTVNVKSYDGHLVSKLHYIGKEANDKFTCECGETLCIRNRDSHYLTKIHNEKMKSLNCKNNDKINVYTRNKDKVNCCSRCFKIGVPDCYFLIGVNLCLCCDEILKGGEKRCRNCKELKDINNFERPYLIRCKLCASSRLKNMLKLKNLL